MAEDITKNPLFQNLSPVKKEVLQEVVDSAEHLSLDKALPLLLKANVKLKKQGENAFAALEKYCNEKGIDIGNTTTVTELTKQLTPQEKAKVSALMKLM